MKKLTTIIAFAFIACGLFAQINNLTLEPKILSLPDFSKISPHPRLLMKSEDLKRILKDIETHQEMRAIHEAVIKDARNILKKPLIERKDEGIRMRTGGELFSRMSTLGYAYRATGEKIFAERARDEVINIQKLKDWNPTHFLDTATAALGMAIAYDWFFDFFDNDIKNIIKNEINSKAINPYLTRKLFWITGKSVNNWNQVCNSGILCAALALYETDKSFYEKIIRNTIASNEEGILSCYSKAGMYIEGTGYWVYGTLHQVIFNEALVSAFGNDCGISEKFPRFLNSSKFVLHMTGTNNMSFNFSDTSPKGGSSPLLLYFAKKTEDTSLLFYQKKFHSAKKGASGTIPLLTLLFASDTNFSNIPAPREMYWFDTESINPVFSARTSWQLEDGLFFAVKGGRSSINHGHMDVGGFVFDAFGERWAKDLGSQNYHSLEKLGMKIWSSAKKSDRWKVFRYSNFSHNILTVNDSLIEPKGFGKITETFTSPERLGATIELSELYKPDLKSASRTIAIIDKKLLRIIDNVEVGAKKAKIRWNVCGLNSAEIKSPQSIVVKSKTGKTLEIKLLQPKNFTAKILSANPDTAWDAKNENAALLGFEGEVDANKKCKIVVEMIPQK